MKIVQGVYGITDTGLLPDERLYEAVEQALAGGISLLQYRDKRPDHLLRLRHARQLRQLCHRHGVPLIINDDLNLCREAGADGLHLGQSDGQLEPARLALGNQAIIGVTCHASLELARLAQSAGADYVAFGRFFPSRTKPQATPASIELLEQARTQITIPIVAIGGIDLNNAPALLAAGADLLAVINYLFAGPAVTERAQRLTALFTQ